MDNDVVVHHKLAARVPKGELEGEMSDAGEHDESSTPPAESFFPAITIHISLQSS